MLGTLQATRNGHGQGRKRLPWSGTRTRRLGRRLALKVTVPEGLHKAVEQAARFRRSSRPPGDSRAPARHGGRNCLAAIDRSRSGRGGQTLAVFEREFLSGAAVAPKSANLGDLTIRQHCAIRRATRTCATRRPPLTFGGCPRGPHPRAPFPTPLRRETFESIKFGTGEKRGAASTGQDIRPPGGKREDRATLAGGSGRGDAARARRLHGGRHHGGIPGHVDGLSGSYATPKRASGRAACSKARPAGDSAARGHRRPRST